MRRTLLASLSLALLVIPPALAEPAVPRLEATRPDLADQLRSLSDGDRVRLTSPALPGGGVELERVPVFTPDAKVVIHHADHDEEVAPPDVAFFRGWTDEAAQGGLVTLSVNDSGDLRGVALLEDGYSLLLGGPASGVGVGLEVRAVDADAAGGGFDCQNSELRQPGPSGALDSLFESFVNEPAPDSAVEASNTARIAIETDQEYLALFGGNTTAAAEYIADLFGYASGIYDAEVDTTLLVNHVSLWASTDPWNQTSSICMLLQYGRYWNDNNGGISRTTSHFLSGRTLASGVAWVGVLCSGQFTVNIDTNVGPGVCPALTPRTDNWGGAYGVTTDIDVNFNPNSPGVLWDIVATAHEVGHNFNSPHSHCYAGLGGNANPVDACYSGQCGSPGCHCGGISLPSGCPGTGNNCGTIMSYCHLIAPGMSNTSLSFGTGHPYGVAPGRIPARMSAHVATQDVLNPGCLDFIEVAHIFSDGFESGSTSAW